MTHTATFLLISYRFFGMEGGRKDKFRACLEDLYHLCLSKLRPVLFRVRLPLPDTHRRPVLFRGRPFLPLLCDTVFALVFSEHGFPFMLSLIFFRVSSEGGPPLPPA